MGVIGLMERFLKCLAFVIISILIFNFSIVYAEETTEENKTADVQVSDEIRREENTTGTSNETNTTDVILDAPEGNSTAYVEDTNSTTNVGDTNSTTTETNSTEPGFEGNGTMEIPVQKVTVKIKKVDPNGEYLEGAVLQLFDSEGNPIGEAWTSGTSDHVVMLPDGKYVLRELQAPEGYDIAPDKEFTVKVVAEIGYNAHTYSPNIPCETATTYTVEFEGKIHEVYCINQFLTEPGDGADYDGSILTPDTVRDYTQQVILADPYSNPGGEGAVYGHGHLTDGPIDVSDQTLNDEQLYNKLLDIVYRRTLAREQSRFADEEALPEEAISFLTEMALKMYTNAEVTQIQRWESLQPGDEATYVQEGRFYWYLMHMYRDYVYDPASPYGYRVEIGHGDSLGNFARHWAGKAALHETQNLSVDHPIYADFYYYLLGDENSTSMVHPEDMYIYIYQANNTDEDDERYQNLIGITGYLEDFYQEQEVVMQNEYSTEVRNMSVVKIWEDKGYEEKRPQSVTVSLYADDELVETVTLDERNEWSYEWGEMPVYENGVKISYTLVEEKVNGYKSTIEEDEEIGFVVINEFQTPPGNPRTADDIVFYIALLLISALGIIKYSYSVIKDN